MKFSTIKFDLKQIIPMFDKKKSIIAKLHQKLNSFLLKKSQIEFPIVSQPDISIILVLYNQAQFTLECLRLIQQQINVRYELIIIDNASTDATQHLLACCRNIVIINNTENLGFLMAANQGASLARGTTLLFLNNDLWSLNKDALSIALSTLNSDNQIGAVGGMVILPKGILQEAGVFIGQEGIKQYARNQSANRFEVRFQRHVDYCSGLFLLTPKPLFDSLGGFDTRYAPAYYEDSDYCIRVNNAGLKVIYEPRIVIGHIEGGSEVKKGDARGLYLKNTALFRNKHKEWIQSISHLTDFSDFTSGHTLISRHHKRDCMRLLFIGQRIPSPALLSAMKTACDSDYAVSYYPLKKLKLPWDKIYSLFDIRIEVCHGLNQSRLRHFMKTRKGYYHHIIDEQGDNTKWISYTHLLSKE